MQILSIKKWKQIYRISVSFFCVATLAYEEWRQIDNNQKKNKDQSPGDNSFLWR